MPTLLGLLALTLAADAPTFERDVRPILARRCVVCHNAKELADPETSGGLALDSFDATRKGTDKHPVVVPGDPAKSAMFTRLDDPDDDRRMPLGDAPLSPTQRETIRRWVEAGATRGEPIAVASVATKGPARRVVRSLDVAVPLAAVPPGKTPVEIRLKVGPLPPVSALAIGDGGKTLAVGTYGQVTLWDLPRREVVRVLDDLPGPVLALAFSPDGKTLAAGAGLAARSGTVRVYDWPSGTVRRTFEGHEDVVSALAFRPDGKGLATASYDNTVRFWDLDSGKPAGVFKGHSDFVFDVAYLPDGKSLLSASKDRTIKRIDAATATEVRSFGEHNEDVLALAVRPDGSGFLSAGVEPAIRSWKIDADKSSKKSGGHSGPVHQLAISRGGERVASASGDGTVRVFDGVSGNAIRALAGPTDWQYAVAITPDGKRVAGGGADGVVRVWEVEPPRLDAVLLQPPSPSPGQPSWLAIAPDGTATGSPDLLPLVRRVVGGKEVDAWPPKPADPPKTTSPPK